VDAGPVLAGNTGSGAPGQELAVLGAAADRCERLAGLAAPGEILVGRGAAEAEGVEPVGPRELGGISVEVFRDTA
jgi:class 3 adenylate cyclase